MKFVKARFRRMRSLDQYVGDYKTLEQFYEVDHKVMKM